MSVNEYKLTVILWCIFHHSSVTVTFRAKKVISGVPLYSRTMGYDSVRYYAWISNGHECDLSTPDILRTTFTLDPKFTGLTWLGFVCKPEPSKNKCGGALITPAIVQTACHCLADFLEGTRLTDPRPAKPRNPWEHLTRIYLGVNTIDLMRIGIPSKSYVVHEKCTRFAYRWDSHDFGWVLLQFSVDVYPGLVGTPISYAPVYTVKGMSKIWQYTMNRLLVCLVIGFGGYQFKGGKIDPSRPNQLLHGWAGILGYETCYNYTHLNLPYKRPEFDFKRDATWSCFVPFTRSKQMPAKGDSGSPITCDNQYFSLVSMGMVVETEEGNTPVGVEMDIAYAVFQNAIEYRRAFMEVAHGYDFKKHFPVMPTFKPFTDVS